MAWDTAVASLNATVRDTFPATATHAPATGGTQDVTVVHDFAWLDVAGPDGQTVSAKRHTAFVVLSDFTTAPRQGDLLTIASGEGQGNYEIEDVQADGRGGATCVLYVVGGFQKQVTP